MEKRYQVFVSSTYEDLKDVRKRIMQRLLDLDCFPAGMELFLAGQETLELIEKTIENSDFYVCIIGGEYGSVEKETGKSYTQLEFECAQKANKKILAFIQEEPKESKKYKYAVKLANFRKTIMDSGTIVKFWTDSDDLVAKIVASISKSIQDAPKTSGWIRFDNKLGVKNIHYGGITVDIGEYIEKAKTIRLITTSGKNILERFQDKFINAMKNGCQISILTATINSDYVNDLHWIQRNNKCGPIGTHDLNHELQGFSDLLPKIKPKDAVYPLIIGNYNTHFRANMTIFDEKYGIYTPTLPPKGSSTGITFELTEGEILRNCIDHFDTIMLALEASGNVRNV